MIALAAIAAGAALQKSMAKNPIIWADVPDPSIVRVGDSYYMSSTTMHMSPGLPIMKSKDLVHWRLVSYAYQTLGDTPELTLSDGKNAYSKGSWASSLRFHDGTFYASVFSFSTGKTYVFSTKDPEREPWKERSFSPVLYDHSLFFDNGRAYMVNGGGSPRLTELKPDLTGVLPGGVDKVIVPDAGFVASRDLMLHAEGNQMFKIDGRYYLCNIAWPKGGMRTEVVHRADHLEGPYVGRIMFQDAGIAQGGMVQTPKGEWYAYLFGDRGAVGRIPYLIPMTWKDGWPVVGVHGTAPATLDIPAGGSTIDGIVASDDFDGSRPKLVWQWNHNPDDAHWSLSARKGFLRITTARTDLAVTQARNTLTQRTFGPVCSGTALLDASGLKDGDRAGLIALMNRYGYVGVKREGDVRSVVLVTKEGAEPVEVASVPLAGDRVYLRMECDFRDQADLARFAYSLDGKTFTSLGKPLKLHYDLVHFMGCRFGLFNYATKEAGGHADFDSFHIGDRLTLP